MKNAKSVTVNVGGKDITLESGALAKLAAGSVVAKLGESVLFSAVTGAKKPREGCDFFPLQVEYREKFYAAGRFPGGFFKREARPGEKETLTSRLTDRPIRSLFPKGYRNEVQINNMVLSVDGENDPDVLSIVASSAALTLSDIPFMGPIAAVRVGRVDGNYIVNPTTLERDQSDFDLFYASTRDLLLMIEGEACETAEEDLIAAMKIAHAECVKLIDAQLELRRALGLPDKVVEQPPVDDSALNALREMGGAELAEVLLIADKTARGERVDEVKQALKEKLVERLPEATEEMFRAAFDDLEIETVRRNVLEKGKRIDGRGPDDLRPIWGEVGILPRTHGSSVFSRGETQALGTATLGTKSDIQRMDAIAGGDAEKNFLLHYNFPPYSVGECGRLGFTSRREIGHGNLAERSLRQVVPEDYPYTIRLVSEVMESNGSSSMASVCAGCLALMDAGVPITGTVAGISIGLFSDENKAQLVTDIIGSEDHCGDMDFKVAGTRKGVTGFQVDLKIGGLRWDLVEGAFQKAREARMRILDLMEEVLDKPRAELSRHAPRIQQLSIPVDKIGELIGPGGKNIRRITELSGAQIDIAEDGTVSIFAVQADSMDLAVREVQMITAEAEEGKIYEGKVTGIKDFGAFVEIFPGRDGLVHISELSDQRVRSVEDVCQLGDMMTVKCIGVDDRGRVKLSRKQAMQEKKG
jgi:polyribonucleotide nucleotidyltransferase